MSLHTKPAAFYDDKTPVENRVRGVHDIATVSQQRCERTGEKGEKVAREFALEEKEKMKKNAGRVRPNSDDDSTATRTAATIGR